MESTNRESIFNRITRLNTLLSKSSDSVLDSNSCSASREVLLDSLILLYDECNNEFLMKDALITEFVEKYRSVVLKLRDLCVNIGDFEPLKVISRGRFADVSVVKEKSNRGVLVIKKLCKSDILNARESIHFDNERNLLLLASKTEETRKWVPELLYSFQNLKYIYYVMEYCPGGNLCTMLDYYKKNIPEPMLRFYMAEIVQAIHSIHLVGFAHRDIKPENIVIDKSGHLKVIDYCSSARVSKNGQITSKLTMSIPHYTAPEVYKFHDNQSKGYGNQCDYWSLGVLLFELVTGSVPFTSEEVPKLYLTSNYGRKLQYPKLVSISLELKSIIKNLLQPAEKRLNYDKIIRLAYFKDLNWAALRERVPPFIPSLTSPEDTSYFNTFESQRPTPKVGDYKLQRRFSGRNLPFLGFTYLGKEQSDDAEFSTFIPKSIAVKSRRETERLKKITPLSSTNQAQRHSLTGPRNSEAVSECSNESYQSAASVRLENEVNQLHLFYNEKALIVEEKLKNQFHDIYNCMAEDQQKLLHEKEGLLNHQRTLQIEHYLEIEELRKKNRELEGNTNVLQEKVKEMLEVNEELKRDYEEESNKFKKVDKMKQDVINRLNADITKVQQDFEEKSNKLEETEEKLMSISNQQAARPAMLNKMKTALRSESVEQNKYEQENVTLKNQLAEANKKILKLAADLEKKNKIKLDLELKMTSRDKNDEKNFFAQSSSSENRATTELVKQFENTVRDVLRENLNERENNKHPDIENMISAIQRKISMLNEQCAVAKTAGDQATRESSVISVYQSQIENLQGQLKKSEENCASQRDEIFNLKNGLTTAEKEITELKIELQVTQHQVTTYQEQIKTLLENKINSKELLKNFENTVKDVFEENLSTKGDVKQSHFEDMISKVQRKLSILSECQILPSGTEKKPSFNKPSTTLVLEAQIDRLEEQIEKARERAILQREEANAAKSKLFAVEKQLADLKIDLRISQRETKEAEDALKELKKKLREDTEDLASQVQEQAQKITAYEEVICNLKEIIENKTQAMVVLEANLDDKSSVIHLLGKEVQSMKTKMDKLNLEKSESESESRNRLRENEHLKENIEKLKNDIKENHSRVDGIKQKEKDWKLKYEELKKETDTLRETCELQDCINEGFENNQKKLEHEIRQYIEQHKSLQEDLEKVQEELKNARKLTNEEKSLRLITESKIKHLENEVEKRRKEIKMLEEDILDKDEHISHLEEKVQQFEEYIFQANDSIEKSSRYIDMMKREVCMLKEKRTELLTRLHHIKEERMSLQNELMEAIEEINSLQQCYGESQLVLDQVKAYYEDRHMKDTTTLQQYSKLNEFLQTKVDAKKSKRTFADKFFRLKGKENLNPKEIENLLYMERRKNKELVEQLYQTRTELMLVKGNETLSKCSPKSTSVLDSYISKTPLIKNHISSGSNFTEAEAPSRLRHNIPHKFETKLCKKVGVKCTVCEQTLSLGHVSYCKECHTRCHVSCSVKMGPTCGLSKALINELLLVTESNTQSGSAMTLDSSSKKGIEGTIRILKDKIWENVGLCIDDEKLSLFEKSSTREKPMEQITFTSIISVDDKVDKANFVLENVPDTEKRCILRITYWTYNKLQKILHLLALNEDDKMNWINIIKRNIPGLQKQITVDLQSENYAKGVLIYECARLKALNVNQMISLSPELALMATNEGLYSLKLNVSEQKLRLPVKITGIEKVKKIKILTKIRIALFICGDDELLKQCDLRMLVSDTEAAECSRPKVNLDDASTLGPVENCKLVDASSCHSVIAVATQEYIMVLEKSNNGFDIIKFEDSVANIGCVMFTSSSLFYCTKNEFYCVDLVTYEKKNSDIFKQCSFDTKSVCVQGIVKINKDLYILCDKLCGIFLNAQGKRIKCREFIRWPLMPQEFVYNKPFLYLTNDNNLSLVYIPSTNDESDKKFKFSIMDYHKPSILGVIKEPAENMKDPVRGAFIKEDSDDVRAIYFLDPVVFNRRNPKESWSSIDTQLTGETTDEECVRKSLNISVETDISLNSSLLEDSNEQ